MADMLTQPLRVTAQCPSDPLPQGRPPREALPAGSLSGGPLGEAPSVSHQAAPPRVKNLCVMGEETTLFPSKPHADFWYVDWICQTSVSCPISLALLQNTRKAPPGCEHLRRGGMACEDTLLLAVPRVWVCSAGAVVNDACPRLLVPTGLPLWGLHRGGTRGFQGGGHGPIGAL